MNWTLEKLEELAKGYGLRVIERGAGHFQILGGTCFVNYYPNGKKRSAHVDGGGRARHGVTPGEAFEMALGPLPAGARVPRSTSADGLDDPSKRTPRDWAALLPNTRYAWHKDEFNERMPRDNATHSGAHALREK